MKRNLLKTLVAVVTVLLGGVTVTAQETYVGTPTVDTWLRLNNNTKHGSEATMELKTYTTDNVDMVGVMVFEFTAPNDGYEVETATLRLVSERVKGDRKINLYDFNVNVTEDAIYADYASDVEEARKKEPIANFSMEGQNNKSVAGDDIDAEKYQTITAWQNNVDLTAYVKGLATNKFAILITRAADANNSNKFFTKEATGINNTKCDYFSTVTATDLVPQLTVTYTTSTGICDIIAGPEADGVMYNLAGQRVASPQRGTIYIKDGHKYIAR